MSFIVYNHIFGYKIIKKITFSFNGFCKKKIVLLPLPNFIV